MVRLGFVSPVDTVTIDYKHHGGITDSTRDLALLDVVRPWLDWRAVGETRPGRRSLLTGLAPPVSSDADRVLRAEVDRVLRAEVARMARVGRAAVVNWRRRHPNFPAATAGTEVHPESERADVVAWLLAHDKISLPAGAGAASLLVRGTAGATGRFRLDAPWLGLADDVEGTDRLSGWVVDDADADALAALAAGEFGATLTRLTAPGAGPLAVLGDVRVSDRFRSGSGALRITLEWPARLGGTASPTGTGGVVRHGVPQARVGEECVCARHDCGGLDPVLWCDEHGDEVTPPAGVARGRRPALRAARPRQGGKRVAAGGREWPRRTLGCAGAPGQARISLTSIRRVRLCFSGGRASIEVSSCTVNLSSIQRRVRRFDDCPSAPDRRVSHADRGAG
ncbi:hypothetical protein [Streptomyces sp. NPDC002467]|uniref:hypothetical protein n=1 Tax=Streptomyces sp. NPDC002467 TaxID=3364647 RepID=UPI003681CEB8